jgi:hypothetical protein
MTKRVAVSKLTADDSGLEYARGMDEAARARAVRTIGQDLRQQEAQHTAKATQMATLVQACASLEEARQLFEAAEADGDGLGATYTQYKSNLLRGFRLGVLPSESYVTESTIRDRCRRLAANARRLRLVDSLASPEDAEDELLARAHDIEEELIEWAHELAPSLQLMWWERVATVRERIQQIAAAVEERRKPPRRAPRRKAK